MKVFFGKKKWKIGGCFFVKKVYLSSTQGALFTVSVFFVSHFIYLGVYAPNAPPAHGLEYAAHTP